MLYLNEQFKNGFHVLKPALCQANQTLKFDEVLIYKNLRQATRKLNHFWYLQSLGSTTRHVLNKNNKNQCSKISALQECRPFAAISKHTAINNIFLSHSHRRQKVVSLH